MARKRQQAHRQESNSTVELVELLGDEYAREVLEAIVDEPRSGGEVARLTSVSKPTAFRRLNRLEAAGLVESQQAIDLENGQHYREFRPVFEHVTVRLDDEGLTVSVDR